MTSEELDCEAIMKQALEMQVSTVRLSEKQFNSLANYLRADVEKDGSFEYRLQRAYRGFLLDRRFRIINSDLSAD